MPFLLSSPFVMSSRRAFPYKGPSSLWIHRYGPSDASSGNIVRSSGTSLGPEGITVTSYSSNSLSVPTPPVPSLSVSLWSLPHLLPGSDGRRENRGVFFLPRANGFAGRRFFRSGRKRFSWYLSKDRVTELSSFSVLFLLSRLDPSVPRKSPHLCLLVDDII